MIQKLNSDEEFYSTSEAQAIDAWAQKKQKLSGSILMERAAAFSFKVLQQEFPHVKNIVLFCGLGNNGGDGFDLARLALEQNYDVRVVVMDECITKASEAKEAFKKLKATKVKIETFSENLNLNDCDLIVDALLGAGLTRGVSGDFKEAISLINQAQKPVLALDLPSGLDGTTGFVQELAVKACVTTTFVVPKRGLLTGDGPDHAGQLYFDSLGVDCKQSEISCSARRLGEFQFKGVLKLRVLNSHKKRFGHVVVIGGNYGFFGAALLAAQAALRSGAGLVTLATKRELALTASLSFPELMTVEAKSSRDLESLFRRADVLALGPGLGQDTWSKMVFDTALDSSLPLVVDADGLNLLAQNPRPRGDWILTPHPGEAARLLQNTTGHIQEDRFAAVKDLAQKFAAHVVLKGVGTLIAEHEKPVSVCPYGNPGMATAGMGDVLTGLIASLVGQGLALKDATELGVVLHSKAADHVYQTKGIGLIASDVIDVIPRLLTEFEKS